MLLVLPQAWVLWGIEPQIFGFRIAILYHWATKTLQWVRSIKKFIWHASCILQGSSMLIADNVHKTYLAQRILIGSYCRLCKCPGQGQDHLMDSKSLYLCLDHAECDDDDYKEKKIIIHWQKNSKALLEDKSCKKR